ncbi:MAG: hypothetical protein KDA86_04765 [Planctomycetaceae bacterium]|nr:hypothetical protein [Planctomycetaceae bacterium]MCA9112330.1 hypothetical protein [Planctomycetaceae bacterium]
MYQGFMYYMRWYRDFFVDGWNDMGPSEYGMLLLSIGVFGWILMKNSVRR